MKTGLVMEGGAMRGMFTAGVTDVLLESGVEFDGAVGVSAGAAFGCNYKSRQPGRVIRYNTAYCRDPRYAGLRSLLKTGDLYGAQFCYEEIPLRLDPFDTEAFQASPMEFYAVCTDVDTGQPVYHKCETGDAADVLWLRASASMPLVSRIVETEGYRLLDGGISDSVPLRWMESQGYDRNVVILTRPAGYVKKPNRYLPLIRLTLRQYPKLVEALARRHLMYQETMAYIARQEAAGHIFVLRPPAPLEVGAVCRNPATLRRAYCIGRATAEARLKALNAFLTA